MYIYDKPHSPPPMDPSDPDRDSTDAPDVANAEQEGSSSRAQGNQDPDHCQDHTRSQSAGVATAHIPQLAPDSSSAYLSSASSKPRRGSLPISFPPLFFQPNNTSSTSLAPSTAEGKPVPLGDTTAAHRTSALQKLNSTYPSTGPRHRYTKSTSAQSTTHSQPVLVRTYSGPSPSRSSHNGQSPRYRPSSGSRGGSRRVPLPPSISGGDLSGRPIQPALSGVGAGSSVQTHTTRSNGLGTNTMSTPRYKAKKSGGSLPLPWKWRSTSARHDHDEAKLPPLDAFSFKSFMADMQAAGGSTDIGADLDRIAEICARSRYSLSNQYEVHVAPHGSGAAFTTGTSASGSRRRKGHSRSHSHGQSHGSGPTLQAITSDDETAHRSHQKRRSGGRRRSIAYGTLETIMSSSRSSEEDKTKKKSAADITTEVRGRATRKAWDTSTGSASASASVSASTGNGDGETGSSGSQESRNTERGSAGKLARKKSASFATAIMDSGRASALGKGDATLQHRPVAALVSEPALPQTSNNHLGVRTAPDVGPSSTPSQGSPPPLPPHAERLLEVNFADGLPHQGPYDPRSSAAGLLGGWGAWIPWRTRDDGEGAGSSHAEGSLRQLLRSAEVATEGGDSKGKVVVQGS